MSGGVQRGGVPHNIPQPNVPQHPNPNAPLGGLQQIQGQQQVGGVAPQLPNVANVANNPGGVAVLQQIQVPTLDDVTGKHSAIRQGLSAGIQTKLDTRLGAANPATAKEVRELLHFGWRSRGATTKETRLDIRTALAGYLAHGGDIQVAARFKEALKGKTDPQIKAMLAGLKEDKGLPLGALSKGLLDQSSPTARRDFQDLKQILTHFPADNTKAGHIELVDDNVTLGRNATGQLEIKNHGLAFAGVTVPAANQNLKQADINALKQEFRQLAAEKYSTQGLTLDFMQFYATTNKQRAVAGLPRLSMATAFQQFQPDGASASTKYQRGDCMCHAEKLKAVIEGKHLQVHVIGMNNQSLTKMVDPKGSADKVTISGVDQVTEGITHTDLMIPYTDEQGTAKILILAPGAGPGDNYVREFNLDAEGGIIIPDGDRTFAAARRVNGGASPGMDATQLQKAQFKFRHNLQMLNSPPGIRDAAQTNVFGIDLLAGTLYLNGSASRQFIQQQRLLPTDRNPAGLNSISFNFKAALADRHGMTTVQVWNPQTNAYVPKQVTKGFATLAFLRMVQKQFGQPDDWLRNVVTLLARSDEYNADILLPSLNTAAQAHELGKTAIGQEIHPNAPEKRDVEALLSQAGDAVHAANTATAKTRYAEAIVIKDRNAADAVIRQLTPGSPAHTTALATHQLAQQAIAAGDANTAATHLNTLARQALVALGVPVTANTSISTLHALADFPVAGNANMISKILALDVAGRVTTNSLSTKVAGLVANVAKHSPILANRLHALALREIAGLEKPGITDYMAAHAQHDAYMADLTSPLAPATLPTAATLGFTPKFHVTMSQAKYDEAKLLATRLQQEGSVSKLKFDDATKTVHIGYTYQTFSDICGGLPQAYRTDGQTSQGVDGFNLKQAIMSAVTLLEPSDGPGLRIEKQWGNPTFHATRQNTRFDAVYDMYDKCNDFNYSNYDTTYSPAVRKGITDAIQGKAISNQMTELLNRYDGFAISDEHGDAQMKQALYDNLDHLAAKNVKLIGIEHLKEAEFGDMLRDYFAQPKNAPMSADLRAALATADTKYAGSGKKLYGAGNTPKFITQIVEKAKQLDIELVPLDTENNNPPRDDVFKYEVRHGAMNMVGEKYLRPKLATLPPGAKYVVFAGGAHNNTHVGLSRGMPGFAQTLGIPSVKVDIDRDPNGDPIKTSPTQLQLHLTLDVETVAKRRGPTAKSPQ